jgi:ubiquinone/menaquinone biosynthesis C-methylase UbiE
MAAIGWSVVGVDWSFELLQLAHRRSAEVSFVAADLRRLPFSGDSFDAAVLWDSTLAVLDSSGAGAGLTEVVRTVRCGCPVVVEQIGIAEYRQPTIITFGPDEATPGKTTRSYSWDGASSELLDVVDHVDPTGKSEHYEQRLRLGTPDELASRLARAGLANVQVEGTEDWSFSAPGYDATENSRRIAAVGWKR